MPACYPRLAQWHSRAMSPTLGQALQGALRPPPPAAAQRRSAIVLGGAGPLGSAVLEQILGSGRFERVHALVDRTMAPAVRGMLPLPLSVLMGPPRDTAPLRADTAVVVFDRVRHSNGREDVFHRPLPEALPALATALHRHGVAHLLVVLPHAPALLPHALRVGLASLDEHAVSAMGFSHVVFLRPSQAGEAGGGEVLSWPQRLARGMLAQLRWMVPQRDQPVRPAKVAAIVAELARQVAAAPAGTRVASPELVWQAAQSAEPGPLLARWLDDGVVPPPAPGRPRLRM